MQMKAWPQTATFLAFALVAGVIVFAGHHQLASAVPGGEAKLAAAGK
jgi:hypothetical protein